MDTMKRNHDKHEPAVSERHSIRFCPVEKLELKSPTVVSLIMTDVCNFKCRHCQNYWRAEDVKSSTLSEEQIDRLIERFIEAGIFHVVVTGGEPLIFQDSLEYLLQKLLAANLSISLNSNLVLATPERMKRLFDIGVDHILTSLNSHQSEVNDFMTRGNKGLESIVRGITTTVDAGIRVSANMIIQRINMNHVYEVGRLLSGLGVKKMFSTRSVMPPFAMPEEKDNYFLLPEESKRVLDEMIRCKDDFGIAIGTLVSYPLCFLGDLDRYRDFVGRGCPSQSGFAIGVYTDGSACTCCHSDTSYGNILDEPIFKVYQKMRPWHWEQHYPGCDGCSYLNVCETGCRSMAHAAEGSFAGKDPLMVSPEAVTVPYKPTIDIAAVENLKAGARCIAPKRLRFRKENGFYLINVRWGSTTYDSIAVAEFLLRYQKKGTTFTFADFSGTFDDLVSLYHRDIIEIENTSLSKDVKMVGHNMAMAHMSVTP